MPTFRYTEKKRSPMPDAWTSNAAMDGLPAAYTA